jgi:lipoyl(octanoyl) transferase
MSAERTSPPSAKRPLTGLFLGQRPYLPVLELQRRCAELRKSGRIGDVALYLEHSPTITLGRGSKAEHLLASKERLQALGVELQTINRGGDITLHAPGQLVGYPIVALPEGRRDVRRYVQGLTATMQEVAAHYGIASGTVEGYIGLWVDQDRPRHWQGEADATSLAKIGAIGVAISRWVTTHGFALNLTTAMNLFELIVPCGIAEHPVTSIQELIGTAPSLQEAAKLAHNALADQLSLHPTSLIDATQFDLDQLGTNDEAICALFQSFGNAVGFD